MEAANAAARELVPQEYHRHLAHPDELMARRLRELCAAVAAEPPRAPPRAVVGEADRQAEGEPGSSTHAGGCLEGVRVVAVVGAQHVPGLRALLAAAPVTTSAAAPTSTAPLAAGEESGGGGAGVVGVS